MTRALQALKRKEELRESRVHMIRRLSAEGTLSEVSSAA